MLNPFWGSWGKGQCFKGLQRMQSKVERINAICRATEQQIEDNYPDLKLCYIVHGQGQFSEAVALREHDIATHPAFESAQIIIKKHLDQEYTSFLGLAITSRPVLLGLARRNSFLALININADSYKHLDDARHDINHLAWHAIDLMHLRDNPKFKGKFKNGPLIPKRSPYNLAKANIKADTFAATLSGLQSNKEAIQQLSKRRAMDVLTAHAEKRAEEYPFVVAMEPSEFAFSEILQSGISKSKSVVEAQKAADEVALIVDESGIGIEQWWSFARPAQDMAWRGYPAEDILGAALNTSEDPYIRAIGYLIADVTGVAPKSAVDLMNSYNAFANIEQNARLHRDLVDSVFEELVLASLKEESSDIMILTANQQNENLTHGNILGWCGSALQAAANAFEKAIILGKEPDQAARIEFEGNKELTTWDAIQSLGERIIERKRLGYVITLGHIADLCEEIEDVSNVLQSVQKTLQDPNYIRKLEAANQINAIPKMGPQGPAPTGPTQKIAPILQPAIAPTGPGLGGGMSQAAMRQRVLQNKKSTEDKAS